MSSGFDALSPLKVDIGIDADATAIAEGVGDNLKAIPKVWGRLFDLLLGRKHARAQGDMLRIIAQAKVDAESIESGSHQYRNGEMIGIGAIPNALLFETITTDCINNIKQCAFEAEKHLLSFEHQSIPEEQISETFFNRWRMEASCISEPELQQIWGRILAGEMMKPKSISFKTFDIIKNFTAMEAMIFAKSCKFIVNDGILLWFGHNLSQEEINTLEEHGLIRFPGGFMPSYSCLEMHVNGVSRQGFDYGDYFIVIKNYDHDDISFSGYSLTQSGKNLYRIIHTTRENDLPYALNAIKESLGKQKNASLPYTAVVFRKGMKTYDFEEIAIPISKD